MNVRFLTMLVIVTSLSLIAFRGKVVSTIQTGNLRTELLVNPIGIDASAPRFSWEVTGEQRGIVQQAYQILVASSAADLAAGKADLWNSGKVNSDRSIHVPYAGNPLQSRTEAYWKVKVWTNKGEGAYSSPAKFTVGLMNENDWQAKWTGLDKYFPWDTITKMSRLSARYFRKEFAAPKEVKKATAYISGLGIYELYINGNKIGDQVLAPGPTDYSKTVKYNTFDVTNHVKQGKNAIATTLGNGRFYTMRQQYKPHKWHNFGYPKMLLQLEVEYKDGSKQTVVSDDTWKVTADGPIRTNNEYDGEEYDATKEFPGWNKVGFNDSKWLKAELVEAPGGNVEAQMNENMKVMQILKPVSIKEPSKGVYILDLGQNIAGWIKMNVKGKRGQKVKLRFAESLKPDGQLYMDNLRDALVTDIYTLKGEGVETWAPRFVYHGFRYVEITGYPGKPKAEDFVGEVVYDDMKTIGSFETSDRTINQVYKNAYWGILDNYKGMPVDCPQRDERQPWLGDRFMGAYGESFIFDNSKMYAKWLDDIQESQTPEGSIPDVAPNFWFYYKDGVTWPGTYLKVAEMVYNQFGDVESVRKHYSPMKKWLNYMQDKYMKNYIVTKDSYGDWCVPPEAPHLIHAKDSSRITDPKLLSTATYYHMLQVMKKFANLLGKQEDIKEYDALMANIKSTFNKTYFDSEKKQYGNNTVTANILPLAFNMIPEGASDAVFKNIVDKIMVDNNGHISTGVIGTQWLMRWLTYNGRGDIAYKLASNRTYPSWGYMAGNGATTIWELWNGNTANPRMNSQNHVMLLGDLIVWYYENLGGIKAAEPAFKKVEMKPAMIDGLSYAKASYHSLHGMVKSDWKKNGKTFTWNITVPGNTTAEVYIPAASAEQVTENGKKATAVEGVKFLRMEGDRAVFEVGSGQYQFAGKQ
ncbi:alpha-L-rhamnosidase [Aridibaculum aurantiacum]|uniref:alpha-L-rhamnosidase n=1 Tax=Aridibaculum aurantiacum TaxID=2810307 RepID=UPI001F5FFBA8|nr:alpha-L-rhamnosidase [Aridibaculum aurantiacum]